MSKIDYNGKKLNVEETKTTRGWQVELEAVGVWRETFRFTGTLEEAITYAEYRGEQFTKTVEPENLILSVWHQNGGLPYARKQGTYSVWTFF